MKRILVFLVAAIACSLPATTMASAAQAAPRVPTKLTYSTPNFQWLSQGGGSPYHLWTQGDYWQQTFTNTGVASATKLKVNLVFDDNSLTGANLGLDLIINGTTLGHVSVHPGQTSLISPVLTIPAISGPDYTVEWLVTSTVPPGRGSVSLSINGPSWVGVGP